MTFLLCDRVAERLRWVFSCCVYGSFGGAGSAWARYKKYKKNYKNTNKVKRITG